MVIPYKENCSLGQENEIRKYSKCTNLALLNKAKEHRYSKSVTSHKILGLAHILVQWGSAKSTLQVAFKLCLYILLMDSHGWQFHTWQKMHLPACPSVEKKENTTCYHCFIYWILKMLQIAILFKKFLLYF